MINKTKILVLFMILALGMVVLAGCGKNTSGTGVQADSQSAESETSIQADTTPDETVAEEISQGETVQS